MMMVFRHVAPSLLLLVGLWLIAASPAQSQAIDIPAGATVGSQTTFDNDEPITNAGTITGNATTFGDNSGVSNSGSVGDDIRTSGDNSGVSNSGSVGASIFTDGINNGVSNSGSVGTFIRTLGDNSGVSNSGSVGTFIWTNGANSGVSNSGSVGTFIETSGVNSGVSNSGSVGDVITTFGANSGVSNSGSVGTSIFTNGDNSGVSNSGSVGTFIWTDGANSGVSNSGSVGTFIRTDGANSGVSNSGSVGTFIRTFRADSGVSNSGSVGTSIRTLGADSGVSNSGFVGGGIFIDGLNPTLTLLPGSVIVGDVDLAGAGPKTLNVGNGLNLALTFVTGPTVFDTGGAPFAVSGNQVAVVDPTGFALADGLLADTTGAISDVLAGQFGGGSSGAVAVAMGNGTQLTVTPVADTGRVSRAWAEVFGGWRDRAGDAPTVGSEHLFGGVVAGVDTETGEGTRIGAFIGGAQGRVDVDHNAQEIDTESVFAGLYASHQAGAVRIDAAVTVGLADYDSERLVANNLAAGGLETAKADYDGIFVSPEITVSTAMAMGAMAVRPSLRLRYAGLWLDGYTESGSAANLTVDDRDVHILEARAQLAMPMTVMSDERGTFTTELRVGVDARTRLGSDRVDAVLLGQGISFDPGGDDEVLTGFAAAAFALAFANGVALTGSIEGGYGTDDTAHATARLRATIPF